MIYVIRIQNRKNGFFKVGISEDPSKRIPDIQTSCPFKISLVALRPGGRKEEKSFHKLLKDYQTNGEWFKDTPETRSILKISTVHQEIKKTFISKTDWFKVVTFLECNKDYSYDADFLCRCLGVEYNMIDKFYHNKKLAAPFRMEGISKEDALRINLVGKLSESGIVLSHPELFTPILGAYDKFWQGPIRVTPFNQANYPGKALGSYTF